MKRKLKILPILFIIIGILLNSSKIVNAHSVELDPNSLIGFPIIISNGKGNITIKDSETGYSLYYQAVEISNTIYEEIEKTSNDGETQLNNIETEIDSLDKERDNLKTIYDEAYELYKEKLDSGEQDEELDMLKTAYEEAKINYENKVNEYNNKIKEYNEKANEINLQIKELIPTYVENNWIETYDKSFSVDLSQFSGDKAFAIWVKLISSDGTISYDEATYTMSGTKIEDIKVEGINIDKTTLTLEVGNSYTLIATITPSDATDKLVTWESEDENIATVSSGKVTAKSPGTTKITATTNDEKYTATCEVTVVEKSDTLNNNTSTNTKEDTTVATKKLPKTGVSLVMTISILFLILISILCYKKYHNYKNIK